MKQRIDIGSMVFLAEGSEGVGAVREVTDEDLIIYVENAGEFKIPLTAVKGLHDGKVMLAAAKLDRAFLEAVNHVREREDPRLAG